MFKSFHRRKILCLIGYLFVYTFDASFDAVNGGSAIPDYDVLGLNFNLKS